MTWIIPRAQRNNPLALPSPCMPVNSLLRFMTEGLGFDGPLELSRVLNSFC